MHGHESWHRRVEQTDSRKYVCVQYPQSARAAARREREALEALDGIPGIPTIERVREDNRFIYHEFPGLDDTSFAQRFGRASISIDDATAAIKPIAAILDAAHKRGVYHGAIDLDHIGWNERDQPSISNWQYSYHTGALCEHNHTKLGSQLEYIAPERVRGEPASAPSDTFSLAMCFYRLVMGDFIHMKPGRYGLRPLEVSELKPPELVSKAVIRATHPVPKRRTQSPTHFVDELTHTRTQRWLNDLVARYTPFKAF